MRIDRERARADYIALGPKRSVRKLAQRYAKAMPEIGGSLGNLKLWCKHDEWVVRAEEHDAQVAGEVSRKAIETQAEATWDAAKELMNIAEVGAKRLKACLAVCEAKDGPAAKTLAEVVIALIKHSSEMTGGQTAAAADPTERHKVEAKIIELWNERAKRRHNPEPNG